MLKCKAFRAAGIMFKIENDTSAFYLATVVLRDGPTIVAVLHNSLEIYIHFLHKKNRTK